MMIFYKLLLSFLVALQIIGPAWVLAIQTSQVFVQGASKSQAVIAGIRGVVTVIPGKNGPGYAPKYRAPLAIGDVISTEEESVAEILLGNQGLVTIQEYSEALLDKNAHGGLSVALEVGAAEWSIPNQPQSEIPLTFMTPNIRATTHGGLVTAEVQPTLGEMARAPRLRDSFLIRTSLSAQSTRDVGLLETFCVNEGGLTIEYPGAQQGLWQHETVAPGECRGFLNGQPRAMPSAMGTEHRLTDWRVVCAVGNHCEIPESAKQLIAKNQMAQALALEQALLGPASEECELGGPNKNKQECIIDEQIVLATTGILAGDIQGSGPGNGDNSGVILPCTGDPQFCTGGGNGNGNGNGDPIPGSPEPNVGGMPPPSSQFFTQFFDIGSSAPGSPAPFGPFPTNIQPGEELWPVNGMPGGEGLLTFLNGDFTADKELLLADSGLLALAPHKGKAPQNSFLVSDLSPDGAGSPSNQQLPIRFGAYAVTLPNFNPPPNKVQLGVEGTSREAQSQQLSQFARSPLIDPDDPLGSVPRSICGSPESCFQVFLGAGVEGVENRDTEYPGGPLAGIDGTIQVRSASTVDPKDFW